MDLKKKEEKFRNKYGQLINKNREQHRFMEWTNHHDMYDVGLIKIWNRNAEVNFATAKKKKDDLLGSAREMPSYEDKAIIFVGRGPSLNKAWEMLDAVANDDRFVIVCTNSSIRFLLEKNIVPDYMCCIDGRQYKGYWTFKYLPETAKQVTALFAMGVDPMSFETWPGKFKIIPIGAFEDKTKRKIKKHYGAPLPSGGNAFNSAVAVFLLATKAKIHLFVGNDLCFKDQFYADRRTPKDDNAYFTTVDIYGEEVKTEIPMWTYKTWLESALLQFWPEYHFFNCSEGVLGVDPKGELYPFLDHMPLDIAIERIKNAWEMEQKPFLVKSKEAYTNLYQSKDYSPKGGINLWTALIKEHNQPFTKALDVGCGPGLGLKLARDEGRDVWGVDIANIYNIWEDNGVKEYCVSAPANDMPFPDNHFDLVTCFEMMEHIQEDLVDDTLKEICRVGSDLFIFTIHLALEKNPVRGYYHLHCTVRNPDWWGAKLRKAGFIIDKYDLSTNPPDIAFYCRKEKV